jgi:hypothetical protein
MRFPGRLPRLLFAATAILAGFGASAQTNRPIYTENCVNGFSVSTHNLTDNVGNTNTAANTNTVHTGSYSISAIITASGGYISFQHGGFNSSPYGSAQFWVNGGLTGGQLLKVVGLLNGSAQTSYTLPKLMTNIWQQISVPLASLGCSNKSNFSGFEIADAAGAAQPVFYVDDVYIGALPAPPVVHLSVLATQTNRIADARWFGVNAVTWDNNLGNSATLPALTNAGILNLRWPGGSGADGHNWATDISEEQTFNHIATNLGPGAQAFITVNYGSGDSNMAAGYVLFDNITNHCHYKYWEIGNECYGSWENDTNVPAHDPYTYAVKAAGYMAAMRAADPTIKIGVVASPGDSSYSNGGTHGATNLNNHSQVVYGWTPVVLATLRQLGAQPDFLIHHVYPQYTSEPLPASPPPPPMVDSDMFILQSTSNWMSDAATLRGEIVNYFGPAGTNIEICCTENNSDSSNGGKQLSSLVNGLYEADTLAQLMQTEINSYLWWDLRNGTGSNGDEDPSLYGWRQYGDEGLITGATGYNPDYYAMKMMQYFARPGSAILKASSDYLLLSAYAARQTNGSLSVLVINKDPVANFNGQLNFSGFSPASNAVSRTYGEFQDNATSSNLSATLQDIATTNLHTASNLFTYSFPPYSLTVLTFSPSGLTTTNFITLAGQMGIGVDWNTTGQWSDGNAASNSAAEPGYNLYDVLANARLRTPATGPATFPGNELRIEGDGNFVDGGSATTGEIRFKSSPTTIPKLVMRGGQVDQSIGGGAGIQCVINGEMDVLSNTAFYNDSANDAGYTINAFLTGSGQITYYDLGNVMGNGNTMNITGFSNSFSGTWNVAQGTLLGSAPNALGTNSITVGAIGALETSYNINDPQASLTLNGQMLLHQNDLFKSVSIGGVSVFAGTYSFAYLFAHYPGYFPSSWPLQSGSSVSTGSGSITVLAGPPPPAINWQSSTPSNFVLTWSNGGLGVLLSATNLNGPWSPATGVNSPATILISPSSPQLFFKLQAQ